MFAFKRVMPGAQNLQDRMEILQANLSTNGPLHPQGTLYQGMLQDPNCPVLLAEVASFLATKGIPLPGEMAALCSASPPLHAESRQAADQANRASQPGKDEPRELQPPVGVAPEPNWMLQEPQRHQGYSWPLYQVLKEAHAAGQPRPKARDVLEAFKERKPPEIVQVNHDGISYYDSKGNAKAADLAAISEAIRRMTS
jgi:hypothetical protein